LTRVSGSVTLSESCLRKGRQPATPADGARAVPAGRGSSPPLPGGSGSYARPALRPVCAETRWTGTGQMQVTPDDARSQEARTGVELWRSVAAASAVVERRQASARRFARAAPVWRGGLD